MLRRQPRYNRGMNAICLVLDRLHVGYLGPLGNTWIETPSFNRLAAEGFVFDQAWIDSPALEDFCRGVWLGLHSRQPAPEPVQPIAAQLAPRGVHSALITDEPAVARHPLAGSFASCWELEGPSQRIPARQMEDTHLARCFARLLECLEGLPQPFLAWCHLRALGAPWDAPEAFRQAYRQEGDPPPLDTAEVPCRTLPRDFDPDEVLPITQAYAGQVTLLDQCVGGLLEWLGGRLGSETLLVVLSARGLPLGEHRQVGPGLDTLHAEVTHVPLVVRLPGAAEAAGRTSAIIHPADVAATLLDFFGVPDVPLASARSLLALSRGEADSFRDRHLIVADGPRAAPADDPSAPAPGPRALVTPAWYYYSADRPELYVLPDDFWQANDVADRCSEIVALLDEALRQCEAGLAAGQTELPPLDPLLLEPP